MTKPKISIFGDKENKLSLKYKLDYFINKSKRNEQITLLDQSAQSALDPQEFKGQREMPTIVP